MSVTTQRSAIRAPEYLPRASVMALLDHVDVFVVADGYQLSRQSHHNRTPIRTPDGRMWLTLPLEHGSRGRPIRDVRLVSDGFWPGKHWRSLVFNYSSTAFFEHYAAELERFLHGDWQTLGEFTTASIRLLASWLGITTDICLMTATDERRKRIGGDSGEVRLVALSDSAAHDLEVMDVREVVRFETRPYAQNFEGFEPDLSALDLLFNWGPDALRMLRQRRKVEAVDKGAVKLERGADVC